MLYFDVNHTSFFDKIVSVASSACNFGKNSSLNTSDCNMLKNMMASQNDHLMSRRKTRFRAMVNILPLENVVHFNVPTTPFFNMFKLVARLSVTNTTVQL